MHSGPRLRVHRTRCWPCMFGCLATSGATLSGATASPRIPTTWSPGSTSPRKTDCARDCSSSFSAMPAGAGAAKPTNPAAALASYYTAIRPYVQTAQAAKVDFVILCDEWSELYYSYPDSAVVPAFRTLVNKARADYTGKIGPNVTRLEETSVKTGIVALVDFVGISAFVPLSNINYPLNSHAKCNAGIDRSCTGSEIRSARLGRAH